MRIKFTKLIPIALVSLVLIVAVACKQKNVKKIVVHNQFAISLYRDTISINDLFNHDSVQYEQTIDMIEGASGIDEVLAKIFSQYEWNQEDKTVIDFLELIYQRFKK